MPDFVIMLVAGVIVWFLPFEKILRAFVAWRLRARGVPEHLIPETLGETNSCIVIFDDEKITHTRRSTGDVTTIRWSALSEVCLLLTDTGVNRDGVYLRLKQQDGVECNILANTEGTEALVEKLSSLYWFSTTMYAKALAVKSTGKRITGSFTLWSAQKDGMTIPVGFSADNISDIVDFDDENITFKSKSVDSITMPWKDVSKLQIVLQPTGPVFRLTGSEREICGNFYASGMAEFVLAINDSKRLQYLHEELVRAKNAIDAGNLKQTVFTVAQVTAPGFAT